MNNNIFCSISTKRSMHHSIMNWLVNQHNGEKHYLGDDKYPHRVTEGHFDHQSSPDSIFISPYRYDETEEFNSTIKPYLSKTIIVNNEGTSSSIIKKDEVYVPRNPYFQLEDIRTIIIVRDCYNTFASCFGLGDLSTHIEDIKEAWKSHAREYLDITNFIPNSHTILANHWAISKDYRESICINLGLQFDDYGYQRVSNNAQGSSFNKMEYDGKASEMGVFNRFEALLECQPYLDLIDDEELRELNSTIFGFCFEKGDI